jgi:hypothetical protein
MRSAEPEFGHGRGNRLMATRSWDYVDGFGRTVHSKAGISFVSKDCDALKLHPSAEFWAA